MGLNQYYLQINKDHDSNYLEIKKVLESTDVKLDIKVKIDNI